MTDGAIKTWIYVHYVYLVYALCVTGYVTISVILPYAKAMSIISGVVNSADGFWRRWYDKALSSGTDLRF